MKIKGNVSGNIVLQILEFKIKMNVSTCYKKSTASKDSEGLWLYLLILSTSSPHSHKNKHFLNCCLRYVGSMKALNIPDVKHQHPAEKVQVGQNPSAQPVVQEDHLQTDSQITMIIPIDKFQLTPNLANKKGTTMKQLILFSHITTTNISQTLFITLTKRPQK